MGDVSIYELEKGWSVFAWLCPNHVKARKRAGWRVKVKKPPPHDLPCQDCDPQEARS